ncbi:HPr family phosphocarrier protein [Sulfurovum sp. bin170]|uniref:HPr family phosphocarrier protein n=1 Tax=Sulfurovum sp. bin170 TaxID=2695268 RepID=UPI0013DF8C79|nr:HPr family phosphocarrier protein [Sulfurovum sp. bin170]NEW60149.1 HPr family phosphocarrier protein [Sulfurovum sp. bin170]
MKFLKQLFKKRIETTLTITSTNGFHLRPIAKFVNEVKKFNSTITIIAHNREVSATQVPKILALALENGESFTLRCVGGEAQKASEHLSSFFVRLMEDDKVVEEIEQEEERYEGSILTGQTIAKGVAIAPIVRVERVEQEGRHIGLPLRDAIVKTEEELSQLYKENRTKDEAQIYLAQKELLNSELFDKNFDNIDEEIDKLKGTAFESRIADYQDLKQRVLSYMGIKIELKLPDTPYILLADELLPSDISTIANTPIQGVILQKGTPTSHASILLRSEAIPSLIINKNSESEALAPNITRLKPSVPSLLDANSGNLILKPTENDLKKAKIKQKKFKEQQKQSYQKRFESTQTKEGKAIQVLANIADIASAKEAKEQGADGVGLFRTEFLFTETKPSLEQQTKAYTDIFELFDNITIRTLDIGGDKSLPYINIEKEDNPFLGIRGIRFSLQEKILFKEQLLAIYKAVGSVTPNKTIKIMFPMVSNTKEFTQAKNIAQTVAKENKIDISNIQFGIMLEVPCVIFALKEFDQLVDFYSIGTNDLTQYLFAIERTHPTLQVDATSPMLMSALETIVKQVNKPISICGELAGVEEATVELIEIGYDTLSVSSKLIPSLKERIRLSR